MVLRQGMCQTLMSADRCFPHLSRLDVIGRLVQCQPAHADRAGCTHDAFGVQPGEQLGDGGILGAHQSVGR